MAPAARSLPTERSRREQRHVGALGAIVLALGLCGCAAPISAERPSASKALPSISAQAVEAKSAGSALGQFDLEPEGIALTFSHAAALDSTAARIDDGSLAHLFVFQGARGDTVHVQMASAAFEPYLALGYGASAVSQGRIRRVRPLAEASARRDTASLAIVLPEDGAYTLLANATAPDQQGPYTIEARAVVGSDAGPMLEAGALSAKAVVPRFLQAGVSALGRFYGADPTFEDRTPYQTWLFEGQKGDEVAVTMRSDEVDPYLILAQGTPGAARKLGENDDADADGTARVAITLLASGTYTVYANTAVPSTGSYALDLAQTTRRTQEEAAEAIDYAALYPGGGPLDGRYALIVGISEYPAGVSDLATPVYDADLMRSFLVEQMGYQPEHVVMLTDEAATREHILHALGRHLGQAGPEGAVLFYYSGHGSQTLENVALGPPLDAEPDNRDETLSVWGAGDAVTDLVDDEIRVMLDALPARRKLLVFDACHSGTAARGAFQTKWLDRDLSEVADAYDAPPAYLTPASLPTYGLEPPPDFAAVTESEAVLDMDGRTRPFVLLSGSESDEYAYTYTAWPEEAGRGARVSVFTFFLLDALEAYASSPTSTLTFASLMDGVRTETVAFMAQHQYTQTPHLSGTLQSMSLAEFFER